VIKTIKATPRRLAKKIINNYVAKLSEAELASWITRILQQRAEQLPPDSALRLLFDLDNRLYEIQGQWAVAYGNGTHTKHRHMKYHDFFVSRIAANQRVLDIGCGIGAVAYDIANSSGAFVWGIDLSEENIRTARQKYQHQNVTYTVGDALQKLPEGPGQFDVIVLSNVLEHLPGRPEFLKRVKAVTNALRFLIRVPLFERDWRVPIKKELGIEWRLDTTHETEYTIESFEQEIKEAGFEIRSLEVHWGEIWAEVAPSAA
jgi:2-polyprenyl-3-methyl-5-hydroxy-6-metoxy-1,4-benzoquinol methylase